LDEALGNRGDWSELFAVASILGNGGAYAADAHLKPLKSRFLKAAKLFLNRGKSASLVSFQLSPDGTATRTLGKSAEIVNQSEVRSRLEALLADLQDETKVGHFHSETGGDLLDLLGLERPSASSSDTASDFDMILMDPLTDEITPRHSFSVKSQLGAPATLLNASGQTNITFCLGDKSTLSQARVVELNDLKWVETRNALLAEACEPDFRGFDGAVFNENLRLVDSAMPEIIANLVRAHYFSGIKRLDEATAHCYPSYLAESEQVTYKVKELMGVLAMGMRPNSKWSGDPSSFKGMVVVTKEGEVVVFYLFNVLEFRDFLFSTLGFERGSSNRHGWGEIYEEAGEWRVKLNLQLRFLN
jgi:hypothetical protein